MIDNIIAVQIGRKNGGAVTDAHNRITIGRKQGRIIGRRNNVKRRGGADGIIDTISGIPHMIAGIRHVIIAVLLEDHGALGPAVHVDLGLDLAIGVDAVGRLSCS